MRADPSQSPEDLVSAANKLLVVSDRLQVHAQTVEAATQVVGQVWLGSASLRLAEAAQAHVSSANHSADALATTGRRLHAIAARLADVQQQHCIARAHLERAVVEERDLCQQSELSCATGDFVASAAVDRELEQVRQTIDMRRRELELLRAHEQEISLDVVAALTAARPMTAEYAVQPAQHVSLGKALPRFLSGCVVTR